ncbi:hypothetical protein ALI22I_23445 [Saccharothrix sp. ALI-22-I]|uniref:hypothetical protein n=1 Tax=Saccharothrix sp. ALI-22-I TaxID=1933778 RepID=UPI00097BE66F|nr:hypothetical protein [Saccharothrix sp. ALI-22-I]ONI86604.1 hypothetical protein ALI22I_23445 [Saccharothrix sp. ALI-22-I]
MRQTIPTVLSGRATACRDAAKALHGLREAADFTADVTSGARTESATGWSGDSGDHYRSALGGGRTRAEDLGDRAGRIALALEVFADEHDAVRAEITDARAVARSGGLTLTATAINSPSPVGGPVVPMDALFDTVAAKVSAARKREQAAREALDQALSDASTFADFLKATETTRTASIVKGLFGLVDGGAALGRSAAANKRLADAALVIAGDTSLSPGLRHLGLAGAIHNSTLFHGKVGAGQMFKTTQRALSKAPEVKALKPFGYAGGGIAAVGVGLSIAGGAPVDKAVAGGAASFAAAALTTAALGAGPPGWLALGASLAVSAGVGYLVDQNWDSIKEGIFHN